MEQFIVTADCRNIRLHRILLHSGNDNTMDSHMKSQKANFWYLHQNRYAQESLNTNVIAERNWVKVCKLTCKTTKEIYIYYKPLH